MSVKEWAEDAVRMKDSIAAAEARGRSGAEKRIAELEHKLHAQRAMVEAAHVAFHEVAGTDYGHTPDEDNPAAMIRLLARAAEERGRRRGLEEAARARLVLLDFLCSHGPQDCAGKGLCVCDEAWPLFDLPHGAVDLARRKYWSLAPRDSAPVCDCEATLWQGGHSPHCATMQPRDSGKEGQR